MSLLVMGAGNCNDLELSKLVKHFASVTLVDIDKQALEKGVRQLRSDKKLVLKGDVDVTGMINQIVKVTKSYEPNSIPDEEIHKLIQQIGAWNGLQLEKKVGDLGVLC